MFPFAARVTMAKDDHQFRARPLAGITAPVAAGVAIVAWLGGGSIAQAAFGSSSASSPGIEVTGNGQARAKPTTVRIHARVSGQAQLAGDAIVKFRDNKRRALDALHKAKIEHLEIQAKGFSLNTTLNAQQMRQAMMGQQQKQPKAKIAITEPIIIKLTHIKAGDEKDMIGRITSVLDVAKDNGLTIGPKANRTSYVAYNQAIDKALVHFALEDKQAVQQQAYKQAMTNARTKAQHLAKLAGVKLGKVVSIREQPPSPSGGAGQTNPYVAMMLRALEAANNQQGTSDQFGQVPIKVKLAVRFAIQ